MKNYNTSMRNTARETLRELCDSQHELENFHLRTMEHVHGMLVNAKELHPLVLAHLNAIKDLGNTKTNSVHDDF